MRFEWDEHKRQSNFEKHRVDFPVASQLWKSPMLIVEDKRREYKEKRLIGIGFVANRMMVAVYTERTANVIRIISLRKANNREIKIYEKAKK